MRKTILAISSFLFTTQLLAVEMPLRHVELVGLLTDVMLNGVNNGASASQVFQKSGVTFYRAGGGQSQGAWKIEGDQYCSTWPPNSS